MTRHRWLKTFSIFSKMVFIVWRTTYNYVTLSAKSSVIPKKNNIVFCGVCHILYCSPILNLCIAKTSLSDYFDTLGGTVAICPLNPNTYMIWKYEINTSPKITKFSSKIITILCKDRLVSHPSASTKPFNLSLFQCRHTMVFSKLIPFTYFKEEGMDCLGWE